MKQSKLFSTVKQGLPLIVTILLTTVSSASGAAEQTQAVKETQANKPLAARPAILYKPPLSDAPYAVVSQSAQSVEGKATILQILAPNHIGLTLQSQPTLYWYARSPVAVRFTIAAIEKHGANPLLNVDIQKAAGIQKLDLGKHGISLQPELRYQWSVIQAMDKGKQSTTTIASGIIERIKPGEGLSSRIKNSHGTELVNVYAIEGIWYDALETISSMIDKSPEDQSLAAIRKSLLKQAGLNIAAEN